LEEVDGVLENSNIAEGTHALVGGRLLMK